MRRPMTGVPRRGFCGLLAASLGAVSGDTTARRTPSTVSGGPKQDDEVVTTREGLEAAFDDLSPGGTIRISDENAPYRTTGWLDVDVDGATVVGPGVPDLVAPADGANVGGIRVGHNDSCRGVRIRGIGYHGNPGGQPKRAKRLHGIAVRNASDVTIRDNRIRHTHPRRHGDGGSGISVTGRCSDVWVIGNRVSHYGDRGIQVGGRRVAVSGNVVTDGLDRAVSCDLWYPDEENRAAENALVAGNALGNASEGSLVGLARNTAPHRHTGFVSVLGNAGFGYHKSFCHVRGPRPLENISVRGNVSIQRVDGLQTEGAAFAGVAIDPVDGRTVTVQDNELYGYSGHGVHVNADVSNLTVRGNTIVDSGLSAVRLVGVDGGRVAGNAVARPGRAGVRLDRTAAVAVRHNDIRDPAMVGILTGNATGETGNDVVGNDVTGAGRTSNRPVPAILVDDAGVRVRGNAIRRRGGPAIAEGDGAENNLYEDNWADGDRPWQITAPGSRVRNNTPPFDVHRDTSVPDGGGVVRVGFDKPYAGRPRLSFGRPRGVSPEVSYEVDENGDYVGAEIAVEEAVPLDVRVHDG